MPEWTHRICERCWFDGHQRQRAEGRTIPALVAPGVFENGQYRSPTQVASTPGVCCVCGRLTILGIFFRHDQDLLRCLGRHRVSELTQWAQVDLTAAEES